MSSQLKSLHKACCVDHKVCDVMHVAKCLQLGACSVDVLLGACCKLHVRIAEYLQRECATWAWNVARGDLTTADCRCIQRSVCRVDAT